jgi:hypothetical protein
MGITWLWAGKREAGLTRKKFNKEEVKRDMLCTAIMRKGFVKRRQIRLIISPLSSSDCGQSLDNMQQLQHRRIDN